MAGQRSLPLLLLLSLYTAVLLEGQITTTTSPATEVTSNSRDDSATGPEPSNSTNHGNNSTPTAMPTVSLNNTNQSPAKTDITTTPAMQSTSDTTMAHTSELSPQNSTATTANTSFTETPKSGTVTPGATGSTTTLNGTTNPRVTETNTTLNGTTNPGVVQTSRGLSNSPGLVAVLCIFVSIICIALVVTAVKFCQKREPEFQKLDEVPMNGINEEAPFARYPPK
ncbi:putative LOC729966 homolog isoform X2 [Ascaphus truei]|uniref:putative LOC729966 homolog isoform X2 n=1 Tax=Ascaphus truei TaxID=8439 RepID=UPI003F599A73